MSGKACHMCWNSAHPYVLEDETGYIIADQCPCLAIDRTRPEKYATYEEAEAVAWPVRTGQNPTTPREQDGV